MYTDAFGSLYYTKRFDKLKFESNTTVAFEPPLCKGRGTACGGRIVIIRDSHQITILQSLSKLRASSLYTREP